MNIEIRPIETLSDLRRCHDIQRATWGYSDLMVIPYTQLVSAQHNGGVLLGAYVDGELVGFLYGYLGMASGRLYHFLQRMGVLPEAQARGIGYKLTIAQREQLLRQGIDIIVWTYDPLEGKNSTLYVEKLGGIVRYYARDIYGMVNNPLQVGLATDRFLLEWHLMSDRVRERVRGQHARPYSEDWLNQDEMPFVTTAVWNSDFPHPTAPELELDADTVLVQLPPDLQYIKRTEVSVAVEWRQVTRTIFETYFRRGYVVTGYASSREFRSGIPNIYRLDRKSFPAPIDFSSWAGGIKI